LKITKTTVMYFVVFLAREYDGVAWYAQLFGKNSQYA
jgi:hypothetical protein